MNREEYEAYLKSSHWQKERRGALSRAEYRCQVCDADDTQLEVHHRTYERLGCERPSDLFVLCESCHELLSLNGKFAQVEDFEDEEWEVDDEYDEEWEADETERALSIPNPEGRLQTLASHAIHHPRLALGGGSFLLSLGVDVVVHFDPFVTVLGLGAAVVIGFKGDDLLFGTLKLLVPGHNQQQVREDADRWANRMLDDYPVYEDQSALAKIRRLFKLEEGQVIEEPLPPLKKRDIPKLNGPRGHVNEEVLTFERIATWLEHRIINDVQFFELLERIENGTQKATRSGRSVATQPASEADVDGQNVASAPAAFPPGWTQEKADLIPGLYRALGSLDKCLDGVEVSRYPRNRDFARDILKQQGLWKEK